MSKAKFYESEFEAIVIDKLLNVGWVNYTPGQELHRKENEAVYEDDLRAYIKSRYSDENLSDIDIETLLAKIEHISGATTYRTMAKIARLIQDGFNFKSSAIGARHFEFRYIDFDTPSNNIFRVVNQFTYHEGDKNYRPDVMLFVNGIPLVIIELKNPADKNATIEKAHSQITNRYWFNMPSLMKYLPLSVISDNAKTKFGTTTSPFEFFYEWKKVNENDVPARDGTESLDALIAGALSPARLLEIYRDYLYFPDLAEGDDKELAVVCRYPQFFATKKLKASILGNLRSRGGNGKGGLYFGATGCGKTFTMLFLARQLAIRSRTEIGSPTVLVIVDREDLESQAGEFFCASKTFLCDDAVSVFSSRKDLATEMSLRKNGGVYVTTIQKFTETMGLLSDRSNIICMSDEAHRTQTNMGSKLKANEFEAYISYGFAKYLRDALPNATYCGFTGTPIDDSIAVFGGVVDAYTMKQSQEDGITVPIVYDPRLARANLDKHKAELIEEYYRQLQKDGTNERDIAMSKKAMSDINVLLSDPERIKRVATDIVNDFECRLEDNPELIKKGMIVCSDRPLAYQLYKEIEKLRPNWTKKVKALSEDVLSKKELEDLPAVPFMNIVATRCEDDEHKMYGLLGDAEHRKWLSTTFKDEKSNFKLAVVVDMWITGFNCPPLSFLYVDKPLQKHTLIQTISRVNRVYESKKEGVIIDYFGIRENMKAALKTYGGEVSGNDERTVASSLAILKRELDILNAMCRKLDFSPFINGDGPAKLQFLQVAAEFVLDDPEKREDEEVADKGKKISFFSRFSGHVKRLSAAHAICNPAGVISEEDTIMCRCYMGIYSYAAKMTKDPHEAVEKMNKTVAKMVAEALKYSKVETVIGAKEDDLEQVFGDEFMAEIDAIKMPNTKFQLLVQMLNRAIKDYRKVNKVRADYFEKMLQETVEEYNTRDKLTFTNQVARDTLGAIGDVIREAVESLNDKLKNMLGLIKNDKNEFKALGISFEEKAFYDILVSLRDAHKFEYPDEKCKELAKGIKALVDQKVVYADWLNNDNMKDQLNTDLLILLYNSGYPPEWNDEVFYGVLEQVSNYKYHQD